MKKYFPKSERHCLTELEVNVDMTQFFVSPPIAESMIKNEVDFINNRSSKEHSMRSSVDVGFADRFICKLALGFGVKIFGDKFLESKEAKNFSMQMWERNVEKREKIPVLSHPFDSDHSGPHQILAFSSSWVIYFHITSGFFFINNYSPFGRCF